MRFLRQSLVGLFLTALTLALLAYAGNTMVQAFRDRAEQQARKPPARERTFSVAVVQAVAGVETPVLDAFGEVQSRRSLELRASAAGRVISLAPEFVDGGEVKTGQVLARIDPADAQSAVDRTMADVADAQAEVRDADRNMALAQDELVAAETQAELQERALRRQRDLQARGVGTAAAVENAELSRNSATQSVLSRRQALAQAEARIDQAKTRLTRANIALSEAERNLEDTIVTAPFDGTLSAVSLVEGRLVSPNEKLADLIDPAQLEVSFRVSTAQFSRLLDPSGRLIKADVAAKIDVSGIDLVAEGWITRSSAGAGAVQTGRLVFAQLKDAVGFKPGDFVTVAVTEPQIENVVRLPASSLGPNGDVLVLNGENRLEALPVSLVRRQRDDVLVRGQGLLGRQVVQARSPLLGAGIAVTPLTEGETDVPAAPAEPELVELSDERRAKLVAFIEGNNRMPKDMKDRVLTRLAEPKVPAQMVQRIESRMGG
ncbi:MAG: HlyD family efflux transporter periplasmic adaptor subunit [Rhodobacteraceae bacterium]|nr:HlyD family efflux transporter periplasmic adaptor subunit [Paracoccaceae bacterium]